jgi:hypothetical protein
MRSARPALLALGLLALALAAGMILRLAWATALWPWPDTPLSYLFLGSILAAIGAPLAWIAISGEVGAAVAGALNLAVMWGGFALTLLVLAAHRGDARLALFGTLYALAVVVAAAVYALSRRHPIRQPRPVPRPVRGSFVVFAAVLALAAGALLLRLPHVFPWPLRADSSVLFGCIFLGNMTYFAHGWLRPSWQNACGQLLGFLAYDLVLLGPFVRRFGAVPPEHLPSLIVYTAILVYSGALAVYYLAIDPRTRLWRARPAAPAPVSRVAI